MNMVQETKAEAAAREEAEAAEAARLAAATGDVDAGEGSKLSVPQKDGEVTVSGGAFSEPRTYKVSDGHITAKDADERAYLLGVVPGAALVD